MPGTIGGHAADRLGWTSSPISPRAATAGAVTAQGALDWEVAWQKIDPAWCPTANNTLAAFQELRVLDSRFEIDNLEFRILNLHAGAGVILTRQPVMDTFNLVVLFAETSGYVRDSS
jgi:hypothetical protein